MRRIAIGGGLLGLVILVVLIVIASFATLREDGVSQLPSVTSSAPPTTSKPPEPTTAPPGPAASSGESVQELVVQRRAVAQKLADAVTRQSQARQQWEESRRELEQTRTDRNRDPRDERVALRAQRATAEEQRRNQLLVQRTEEVRSVRDEMARLEAQIRARTSASSGAPRPEPAGPTPAPSPRTRLDELVSQFKNANGAMAAPERAMEGKEETVALVLTPAGTTREAMEIATAAAPRSTAQPLEAKVHELMEAKLTGEGFRIVPRTPERQAVPTVEPTRWEWTVVPVKTGQQSLHVALSAVVEAGGDRAPRLVTTFERTVLVAVQDVPFPERMRTFAERHWQWLLGALGTALGAGWRGAVWWSKRRKRAAASPAVSGGKFE